MNNFLVNVEKIFETLKPFESKLNLKKQIRQPKMSDLELIAVDLTAEDMSIDSERQLFRVLPQELSSRIEHSVYNKRRRALFEKKHHLQQLMAEKITGITALTTIQLINKLLNRNINHLKICIA
jgi:hypothetical protein